MDKAKKKRIKRYLTWISMAALVALLTVMPLLAKSEAEADGPVASILSATAEPGTITTDLHGGGTLEARDDQDVTIPSEVKITEFLVKNGSVVTEGTPLALVDKVSVMSAITGVSDTLDYLREELEDAREERVDSTISATAGGRVKKIFAQEGESVQEVMLRDGCLAILSLDGLMAVKIDNGVVLTTGESVDVRLADGTAEGRIVTGRVESSLNGVKIITVEDEGYAIGAEVTVSRKDGEAVGSGALYIHNAWKATGYSGTISRIHTSVEKTLGTGAALFSLTDRDYTGQMQHRANQHREYEELLQSLLKLYESGTITAPCDGVVSGLDQDSAHLLSAEAGEWYIQLLSSVTSSDPDFPNCTNEKTCTAEAGEHRDTCPMKCTTNADCQAKKHESLCITLCTRGETAESCTAQRHYSECIHSCISSDGTTKCPGSRNHYPNCIENCISSDGTKDCPSTVHRTSCIERCCKADIAGLCDADEHHHYPDCLESCTVSADSAKFCPSTKHKEGCYFTGMTYTAYGAKVDAVAATELIVYTSGIAYPVEYTAMGWVLSNGAKLEENLLIYGGNIPTANAASFQKGDLVLWVTGVNGDKQWTDVVLYQRSPDTGIPGMGDFGGMMGGMSGMAGLIGGFSGYGNYSGMVPETEEEGLYDLEGDTLLTVTPRQEMEITINLDEQDISKVFLGMEAQVKINAVRGEVFPAKVTKIGTAGTNNGGSSKFTVTVTLTATEDMLSGMSATVQIPLENRENVLTIPVAALDEEGAKTVVYTALDEKTGEPTSPVEVTAGIADGERAQILSGLNPGDTVYYRYYDTLELDASAEADRFTLR